MPLSSTARLTCSQYELKWEARVSSKDSLLLSNGKTLQPFVLHRSRLTISHHRRAQSLQIASCNLTIEVNEHCCLCSQNRHKIQGTCYFGFLVPDDRQPYSIDLLVNGGDIRLPPHIISILSCTSFYAHPPNVIQ